MGHRSGSTILGVAVLAAAVLGTPPALAQGPGGPVIAPCSDVPGVLSAQCGSIAVPLDRANPGAGTTRVAFALVPRRKASEPSAGTLLFNPGGPGVATIADAGEFAERFAPLLDRRDLLLVDPRGTGRSDALRCGAFDVGLVFAPRARFVDAIGACGRELGSRAPLYGSAAVADDFDAVRAALGLDRFDLWGESYGTYLMPVYAARYPQHVRSMVLSGTYPTAFDPWGLDRLGASRRAIRLVCARTRACRGGPVLRDVAALAGRLRRRPVSFPITVGAQRFRTRLDEAALATTFYTGGNAQLFGALPAAAASGRAGDLAPMRRLVETDRLMLAYFVTQQTPDRGSLAQSFATQCHDYPRAFSFADPPAARRAAYERARAAIGRRAFFPLSPAAWTSAGFEAADTCIEWPDDPTAAAPIPPGTTMPDVPVLVLSGDLDANTPSFAGRQVARQFKRATFAEIPNEGHTPTGSRCALRLGLRFVVTSTARANACAGTGTPPPVAPRAALLAADLAPVRGTGTPAERRALGVAVATANDLDEQALVISIFGSARGLRGGRYIAQGERVRVADVRVVRDARASGRLVRTERRTTGSLRLSGRGTPHGRLTLRLTASGRGRAAGILDGRPVRLAFRFPALRG